MSPDPPTQTTINVPVSHTCPEDCFKRRLVFWLLVVAQFFTIALIVLLLRSAFLQPLTAILAGSGIALGAWAIFTMDRETLSVSPQLRKSAKLTVSGPYRFVRHPMYTALLMFGGSYAMSDNSVFGLLLWCSLAFILIIKMAYEEVMLKRRFQEYESYSKRVKRLVPFVF